MNSKVAKVGKRAAKLGKPVSPKVFPPSQGWCRIADLTRKGTIDYVRYHNGKLELQHFCLDNCAGKKKYLGLPHYCCSGVGS